MVTSRLPDRIEQEAGHYAPAAYAALTQGHAFEQAADPLSSEFIPLSTVKVTSETKAMIFGILPPATPISGRLLDRSASSVETALPESSQPTTAVTTEAARVDPNQSNYSKDLPPEFWTNFVGMAQRANVDPIELAAVFFHESGFNPSRVNVQNGVKIAKGIGQLTKGARVPMPDEVWQNFENLSASEQLAYFEPFVKRMGFNPKTKKGAIYAVWLGGYPSNPSVAGGSRYANTKDPAVMARLQAAADQEYRALTADPNRKFSPAERKRISDLESFIGSGKLARNDFQAIAYEQNKGLDKDKDGIISIADLNTSLGSLPPAHIRQAIEAALACGGTGPVPKQEELASSTPEAPATTWCQNGAPMSEEAKRREGILGPTGYNSTRLGQMYMDRQRAQIQETQLAVERMRNTPPLKMLVNPNSWSVSHEKILSEGERSRVGPILQVWGSGQPKISASGKVPGFFSLSATDAGGPGLTRHARNYSAGWQNFQSLYTIYRNNGRVWLQDHMGPGNTMNLSLVGSVYIYYDNTLYLGSFDSLNITESDTAPFSVEYQFEFSVRAMFLLDRPIAPGLPTGDLGYLRGGALPGQSRSG
jgi:hypothetical protein